MLKWALIGVVLWALFVLGFNAMAGEMLAPVLNVTPEIRQRFKHKDDFYRKYVNADGLLILSSGKTSDRALREARHLVRMMLKGRPDVLRELVRRDVRVGVMAYTEFTTDIPEHSGMSPWMNLRARGLGGNPVTCGEENLLQYPGDRYKGENIFVHEFAHIIHGSGLNKLDPGFKEELKKLFDDCKADGRFSGYGMGSVGEFWAEGYQSWFNTNRNGGLAVRRTDGKKLELNDRKALETHLPKFASFIRDALGGNEWTYTPVAKRLDQPHLRDYDPTKAPTFTTPKHIQEAGEKHAPKKSSLSQPGSQTVKKGDCLII